MHRWLSHFQLYCWIIIVAVACAWLVYIKLLFIFFILMLLAFAIYKKEWRYCLFFGFIFSVSMLQIMHYQSNWLTALSGIQTLQIKPVGFSQKTTWGYHTLVQDINNHRRYSVSSDLAIEDFSLCIVEGEMKEFNTRHNPFQTDFRQYFYAQKIFAQIKPVKIECSGDASLRVKIKKNWLAKIDGKHTKAVVAALVFGDKYYLNSEQKSHLLNAQIMHLFVISGAHIVFIMLILMVFLRLIYYLPIKQNHLFSSCFIAVICSLYAYLAGFEVPVFRAIIALLFWLFLRRYFNISALSGLLALAALILVTEPLFLLNISFVLSFVMVFVIVSQVGGMTSNASLGTWLSLIIKLWLVSSVLSTLFHMPINYLGVFNNIIMSWLVSLILLPISLFSLLLLPFFSGLIEMLFSMIFAALAWMANHHLMIDSFGLLGILMCVLLMTMGTQIKIAFYGPVLIVLFLAYQPPLKHDLDNALVITNFDVGQGQATLIQTQDVWVLYDMGFADKEHSANPKMIQRYLTQLNNVQYFIWVVGHSDSDHSGGFEYLIKNTPNHLQPELILMGQKNKYLGDHKNVVSCHGKIYQIKQTTMSIAPLNSAFQRDNDQSCVIRISYKQQSILLSGDISKRREYHLLDLGWFDQASVLQLAHHGSNTSTSDEFIKKISPKVAINSSGSNNRFNHPHETVLQKLQNQNIKLLDTALCGATSVVLENDEIQVQCHKSDFFPWQKTRE